MVNPSPSEIRPVVHGVNSPGHNLGKRLIREYYTKEELDRMRKEFAELQLSFDDFPSYVEFCYNSERIDPCDPDER